MKPSHAYAPRIYFIHAPFVGPLAAWPAYCAHAASLGFDHLLIGAPLQPGAIGHAQLVGHHGRPHPAFETDLSAADMLRALADLAREHGLTLLIDIVIDRVAADGVLFREHGDWFHPFEAGAARLDPRHAHREDHVGYANFDDEARAGALADWWAERLASYADAGVGGFRFDSPHRVPASVWRQIGTAVRARHPDTRFIAATPGLAREDLAGLETAGFDNVFSSLRWWDFRSTWLVEEHAALTRVGAPLAFPEAPYGSRLAAELPDLQDLHALTRAYRRALTVSAGLGTGWMMPAGFEYGVSEPFSYVTPGTPHPFETLRQNARFDLGADVAHANALLRDAWTLNTVGELRALSGPGAPVAALLRGDTPDLRDAAEAVLVLVNPDLSRAVQVEPAQFLAGVPGNFTRFSSLATAATTVRSQPHALPAFALGPGECRLFRAAASQPVQLAPPRDKPKSKRAERGVNAAIGAPRVAIESVSPALDHGRFPVKRIVGETLDISAAIFAEGHDRIAAAVIWRAADETAWHETPMQPAAPAGLDLWQARVPLDRVGRHEFTVIAWRDDFASLAEHVRKKRDAGQDVALEMDEAAHLFALMLAEAETVEGAVKEPLESLVKQFAHEGPAGREAIVLDPATARAVAAARHRPFLTREPTIYRVDAERAAAGFASWYEIFPRSMSGDENRHGTFADVIAQLPRIRDMGFDVLYFPPIHPIGATNRKGRNNTLEAQPGDVGSPYAIGAAEGGHTAVHPQLGTLDDFRQMLLAAHAHGLEIALDFAIQCSPDHPWLREHPTWFAWRPDGTLRYAENPPKKYQDIVNPDFYAPDAKPALWFALRDVILFWIDAGVRIFRVDNPHTKPLPFWEWLIDDVRARHPETIFLAEAFTRPRVMSRLAKLGFSQSYTYFTWRESKRDFIEYLSELTQPPASDCFRPNFFVNTPDINPRHLQSSGRSGFLIRAALAATLSGLWGVYCGFELCEARALPNSEEYQDSEKYQLRAWDWQRPGHIAGEIAALNRIRRANPALHTHLGLTFLTAHNDHILFFEKATAARDNVVVIAVNLDPFNEQGADVELSRATFERWQLPDHAALDVVDEFNGHRFAWHGRWQHLRLDPRLPFGIWRIAPAGGLPAKTPELPAAGETIHELEAGSDFPTEGTTI